MGEHCLQEARCVQVVSPLLTSVFFNGLAQRFKLLFNSLPHVKMAFLVKQRHAKAGSSAATPQPGSSPVETGFSETGCSLLGE